MANDNLSEFLWRRPDPSIRKPRFSRDRIARTAIAIADAHGFEAVTMKRIAAELGSGTMTLYYYVSTKSDIVALMQDAILEDLILAPSDLPSGWRDGLAAISRRTREVFLAHPWAMASLNDAQFGPNATRHYEQSLAVIARLSLPMARKIELLGILDDYVVGSALHSVEALQRARAAGTNPGLVADAVAYGEELLASGEFPQLAELSREMRDGATESGPALTDSALDRQFELGLDSLLGGLAHSLGLS
jgi:AcrR family transcriptional regulator